MKYTIKHGSIAAMQHVIDETGKVTDCIYMAENEQPKAYPEGNCAGNGVIAWEALPLSVRAAVNRQFGAIFSLSVSQRQKFINNSIPFEVEA